MRRARSITWTVVAAFALVLCCVSVFAQEGRGGPGRLTPEQVAKASELEARTVAQILSLPDEQVTKLVDAYKAARESHTAAMRAQMGAGERGPAAVEAMMKLQQTESEKLGTALKAFLTPEQTEKALGYLGSFNRRWDQFVLTLDGMNLEDAKKTQAMARVAEYAAESGKLRGSALTGGDMQAVREKSRELKTKLDADLGGILTPEQLVKWKGATAMRGGPGGPGGPPPAPPAPAPENKPAQ